MDHFVKLYQQEAQQAKIPFFIWGHSMVCSLISSWVDRLGWTTDVTLCRKKTRVGYPRNCVSVTTRQTRQPSGQTPHVDPLCSLQSPPQLPTLPSRSRNLPLPPTSPARALTLQGKHISRDPEIAKKYDSDPLVHGTGTLLGLYTMLTEGENLVDNPPKIPYPLLVQHGTEDKATSFEATRQMFAKLPPGNPDREFKAWEGYYHELHNEPEDERNEAIKYIAEWILARCGENATEPRARL